MALSAKVANRVATSQDGLTTGVLVGIVEDERELKNKTTQEQFKFTFEVQGTKKAVQMNFWTGTAFSSRTTFDKVEKVERWNKLTTVAVKLGALDATDVPRVEEMTDEEVEQLTARLEGTIGTTYKFKTVRSKTSRFDEIVLESIQPA